MQPFVASGRYVPHEASALSRLSIRRLAMSITYRPAREADLVRSDQLVVASINDLTQRHGFGPMAASSPPAFQLFSLRDDADGLWVAKEADEIVGFAWSWTCGDLWFLAQLFVSPDHQGRSIGNELPIVRHALESALTLTGSPDPRNDRICITSSCPRQFVEAPDLCCCGQQSWFLERLCADHHGPRPCARSYWQAQQRQP